MCFWAERVCTSGNPGLPSI
uniref:Uncharacterized protein n=1 Tax=Anguilla anguilla TaxID=7936 RepID=A0A0E9PXC9_ANGAN